MSVKFVWTGKKSYGTREYEVFKDGSSTGGILRKTRIQEDEQQVTRWILCCATQAVEQYQTAYRLLNPRDWRTAWEARDAITYHFTQSEANPRKPLVKLDSVEDIRPAILQILRVRRWSRAHLAETLGVTSASISRYLSGELTPSASVLLHIQSLLRLKG